MLRSILMGLVAGQRAMTPLAALVGAAQRGTLPYDNGEARLLALPFITAGGVMMGALEMAGDKMKTAPDRTVFLGLLARTISSGFAGATLAPPKRQLAGAAWHRGGHCLILCGPCHAQMGDAALGADRDRLR